jgi:outer membrane receptor protein involved in Fe transport
VIVDATYFFNRYDDLIVAVGRSTQDYSRYRTDNIANAQAQGVEASFALRMRRGFEARASYTFADAEVLAIDDAPGVAPAPFAVGDWLLRRPRHQANVDLLWRHRFATAYLRIGGRSRILDVEPNWGAAGGLFHSPGFGVADAGVAIHAARQLDVVLRADNLFDRRYEAVFGYPAPRRSFTIGVRLAAGR